MSSGAFSAGARPTPNDPLPKKFAVNDAGFDAPPYGEPIDLATAKNVPASCASGKIPGSGIEVGQCSA